MHWRDHLRNHLLEQHPETAYALDDTAYRLIKTVLPSTLVYACDTPPDSPCALALGIDILSGLSAQEARQLINQTRMYKAPRILLAVPKNSVLDETAFRALGFMQSPTDVADAMRIFHYDLKSYKTVPDWLNARFWAHPEHWKP
ncbi:MAG: hypothetical protein B7X94_04725 [Hydrogenophilales bacterium 17-62-8]|nr:MAG: hypothetical protein B7X94_04725 [Hydrogenophilales bacterium 17-62-8]